MYSWGYFNSSVSLYLGSSEVSENTGSAVPGIYLSIVYSTGLVAGVGTDGVHDKSMEPASSCMALNPPGAVGGTSTASSPPPSSVLSESSSSAQNGSSSGLHLSSVFL